MNSANEEANFAFQKGLIKFLEIEDLVFAAVKNAKYQKVETIDDIMINDQWARDFVKNKIEVKNK